MVLWFVEWLVVCLLLLVLCVFLVLFYGVFGITFIDSFAGYVVLLFGGFGVGVCSVIVFGWSSL